MINSASSWFSLQGCIEMHSQQNIKKGVILLYRVHINYQRILQNHIFTNTEQKYICYYHLKEECLQFHSDLKCIRCAPLVWHGRCPGDTPIPAKPTQACLVWRSQSRCWCALAILVVSLEVVGRKHCPWRNPTSRISVRYLWKYGFAKSSDNLYAPCIIFGGATIKHYIDSKICSKR